MLSKNYCQDKPAVNFPEASNKKIKKPDTDSSIKTQASYSMTSPADQQAVTKVKYFDTEFVDSSSSSDEEN